MAYMRWHVPTKPARKKRTNSARTSIFSGPSSASRRRHQITEIYSKLYYKERILPSVRERVEELGENAGQMISIIRDVTAKLYETEDEEIKAVVEARMAELKALNSTDNEEAEDASRTPQQYQELVVQDPMSSFTNDIICSAIDEMPEFIDDVLQKISSHTGGTATFIFGAPIPKANGTISTTR